METQTKVLIWDKLFSTYWWEISLNPNHPSNKDRHLKLTGYSKAQGQSEHRDKHALLLGRIVMLIQRGYIEKCERIQIFQRRGTFIEMDKGVLILELTPKDYCITQEYKEDKANFNVWMKQIYNEVLNGQTVDYLLPKPKPITDYSKDEKLNPVNFHWKKISDLTLYVEKLLSEGFPRGAVLSFYQKSVERFPNMFNY